MLDKFHITLLFWLIWRRHGHEEWKTYKWIFVAQTRNSAARFSDSLWFAADTNWNAWCVEYHHRHSRVILECAYYGVERSRRYDMCTCNVHARLLFVEPQTNVHQNSFRQRFSCENIKSRKYTIALRKNETQLSNESMRNRLSRRKKNPSHLLSLLSISDGCPHCKLRFFVSTKTYSDFVYI